MPSGRQLVPGLFVATLSNALDPAGSGHKESLEAVGHREMTPDRDKHSSLDLTRHIESKMHIGTKGMRTCTYIHEASEGAGSQDVSVETLAQRSVYTCLLDGRIEELGSFAHQRCTHAVVLHQNLW
jgi:hypothetical protein